MRYPLPVLLASRLLTLLFGCGIGPAMPVSDPDPVYTPPTGPGKITGTLIVKTPALYMEGSSRPKPMFYGGTIGAYKDGDRLPVKQLIPSFTRVASSDPYTWKADFTLDNLPLGTYKVKLAHIENPDWDIYDVSEYLSSTDLLLSNDHSSASAGELKLTDPAWGEQGEISGSFLLNGLEPDSAWVTLDAELSDESNPDNHSHAAWQTAVRDTDHGRLNYRITGLSLGKHMVAGSLGDSWRISNEGGYHPEPVVTLTEDSPAYSGYDVMQHVYDPSITNSSVELTVHLPDAWDGYLVVDSHLAAGVDGPQDSLHYFLFRPSSGTNLLHDWVGGMDPDGDHTLALYQLKPDGQSTLIEEFPSFHFESYEVEQTDPPSLMIYPGTYYRASLDLTAHLP